ncbi:MAG: ATP-binding protein [Thermoanaerobaculales bacterium]|nr:ATP-binding protein [Thermoanaerobaculales bacterium]
MPAGLLNHQARLSLESRFENIEVAERVLLEILRGSQTDADQQYWLLTALREAVANAVRHGSRGDFKNRVRLGVNLCETKLTIFVRDQGPGFDSEAIPDPTEQQNLLRPSGRGIFYMRRFMDAVDFTQAPGGGTLVTMSRNLERGPDKETRNEKSDS